MNRLTNILLGILIFSCLSVLGQLGQAVITQQPIYEKDNGYIPHDYFVKMAMDGLLDTAVSIEIKYDTLFLNNKFNDGFSGHEVQFKISRDFEITEVGYDEWIDVIDGSETEFIVEKTILSFSDNPFEKEVISGHYTLQIKEIYHAGKLLSKEGVNDTTTYRIFNGKFKLYLEKEKLNGREWLIDQNEIRMGIKDSLGIYRYPDNYAEFKFGDDSLKAILEEYKIDRAKTELRKKSFITLHLIIDENGNVDQNAISIREPMKSLDIIEIVKQNADVMTSWFPAIYKGRPVKSEVNLPITIK